jgi:hypothetical protein
MSNTFLAEDFRLLLNMMQDITEADDKSKKDASGVDDLMTAKTDDASDEDDSEDTAEHGHVDDLLQSDRTEDLTKESVTDVMGLIEYLDQFSELNDYRDQSAEYDDAYYANVPLDEIMRVTGLSEEDLHRIDTDTDVYEGTIWLHDSKVDIFGSD